MTFWVEESMQIKGMASQLQAVGAQDKWQEAEKVGWIGCWKIMPSIDSMKCVLGMTESCQARNSQGQTIF